MVGTILLTRNNYYVDQSGDLPVRPKHDKMLLTEICARKTVSNAGYELLPPSIQKLCMVSDNPQVPITIQELSQCDILIISRSPKEFIGGKIFRLDNFNCIVKDRKIEIWSKKWN